MWTFPPWPMMKQCPGPAKAVDTQTHPSKSRNLEKWRMVSTKVSFSTRSLEPSVRLSCRRAACVPCRLRVKSVYKIIGLLLQLQYSVYTILLLDDWLLYPSSISHSIIVIWGKGSVLHHINMWIRFCSALAQIPPLSILISRILPQTLHAHIGPRYLL